MKREKKDTIRFVIVIVIISIAATIGLACIAIFALKPPDKGAMEKHFKKDRADIALVTDYFISSGHSEISISKLNYKKGFLFTSANRNVKIEDEAVVNAIERLYKKRGYKTIGRDNNTIFFEKWAFLEKNRGVAFSINGEDKPAVEFLTELMPLSEDGWYYYESDYEEYRNGS